MQVYRYMDIGTAKPTPEEQRRVRHHLIDLVTPDQPFHADLYRVLGRKAIDQLYQDGKPIWVVGGTGLYLKSLTQGLFTSPRIDPHVRERLKRKDAAKGEEFPLSSVYEGSIRQQPPYFIPRPLSDDTGLWRFLIQQESPSPFIANSTDSEKGPTSL